MTLFLKLFFLIKFGIFLNIFQLYPQSQWVYFLAVALILCFQHTLKCFLLVLGLSLRVLVSLKDMKVSPQKYLKSMQNKYVCVRVCLCTPPTYVTLKDFSFKLPPWQCEEKQCSTLPNTCLAPAAKGDENERWGRNKKWKQIPGIFRWWTVTEKRLLLLAIRSDKFA